MTVNLEMAGSATGNAGARHNRQHAEARQDRWLCELERAALIGLKRPDTAQDSASPARQERAAWRDERDEPALQDMPAAVASQQTMASAAAGAARPNSPQQADTSPDTEAGAAQALRPAAASAAPSSRPLQDASAAQAPSQAAGTLVAAGAAAAPVAAAHAPAAPGLFPAGPLAPHAAAPLAADAAAPADVPADLVAALFETASPAAQLMASTAAMAAQGTSALRLAGVAAQPPAAEMPLQPAAARAALGLQASGMLDGAMPGSALAELPTPEVAPAPAAARPLAASGDPYARQQLHLYHGDDGVHAFVRDAALNAAQAVTMLHTMSGELGAAGTRLQGLTVNGRKVSAGPARNSDGSGQHDELAAAEEHGDALSPLPFVQQQGAR